MRLSQLAYSRLRMATMRILLDASANRMCRGHRPSCGLVRRKFLATKTTHGSSRPRDGRALFKVATRVAMLHGSARSRCRPASALMLIHDADGLHERIADRR